MRQSRILAIVIVFLLFAAAPALAQSPAGVEARVVVGISLQGGVFGDDSPRPSRGAGLTVGAQARWRPDRGTGVVVDVAFHPVALKNPHFDERLRVLTIQVAPEIGKNVYVRPGAGLALHFWSGDTQAPVSFGPTFGAAFGIHREIGDSTRITPEIIASASVEPGALAWTLGAQATVSRRR